jgi:TP901 family phage tail tape measure protein
MSNVLQYTLSLQDQISAKLNKIGITSDNALDKFAKLQTQSKKTSQLLKDMGGSVGSLREKLALLKAEKEWIPQSNITSIRKYNTEIKNLEKEILRLDTINGSAFNRNLKGAINNLPFADLITNPVAQAGAALFQSGKMAMSFDEGMAKINTTAQLNSEGLNKLKGDLKSIGRDAGADLSTIPDAYEKILSQTGDIALSTDILKTALKGSKAGFTDADTVAGALAQSLSLIGKENTNAQEVMDTFFAAKRVGAGEFKDFANYMPGLISAGKNLGVGFKQTAGLFAYMTGKGMKAEESATLMQNAFTALGKSDIQKGLSKAGVQVFDKKGAIRDFGDIMQDLNKRTKGMSDKTKSNFLEKVGLKDVQAKNAFSVLASDNPKLREALGATKNAMGETDKAFQNAQNPMMRIQKMWSDIQSIALSVGDVLGLVLIPVFGLLSIVVGGVADGIGWFSQQIQDGNPWILGLIGVIGLLTFAYYAQAMATWVSETWTKRKIVTDKLSIFWTNVGTSATNLLTGAVTLLTSAYFLVPVAIIALIAIIAYLVYSVDGWGAAWHHTVNGAKLLFQVYVESVKFYWSTMVNVIMMGINLIKKGWYEFKEAVGIGDSSENQKMLAKINADTDARKKAIVDGAKKIRDTALKAKDEFVLAGGSLKSNGKTIGDFGNAIKEKLGFGDKGIKAPNGAPNGKPKGDGSGGGSDGTKTNDAIATGGTKHNYYTITIKEINGIKADVIQSGKEAANKAGSEVADGILRALAMAASSTGS